MAQRSDSRHRHSNSVALKLAFRVCDVRWSGITLPQKETQKSSEIEERKLSCSRRSACPPGYRVCAVLYEYHSPRKGYRRVPSWGIFPFFFFFLIRCNHTLVVQRKVSGRVLDALCLASRHNAQKSISFIDLRGLSVGLHDGSFRRAHDRRHHLLEPRNWALHGLRQDLRHEVGDLLDEIWRVHRRLSSRSP